MLFRLALSAHLRVKPELTILVRPILWLVQDIRPNTPITHHQIRRINPPLDLQQLLVIRTPEDFFPVRLVGIRFINVCPTIASNDLLQFFTYLNEPLLAILLLRRTRLVGPVDTETDDCSTFGPDWMDGGLGSLGWVYFAN